LKFKYIFKYYKKKIQMEDIIIILEKIKILAEDLRNESLRKEIERIKKMNQMNEQLFISK